MSKPKKTKEKISLFDTPIKAGFPSPADEYLQKPLDLNAYLISHPASTYILRVKGDSMINAGIFENDLLIVDRSISPTNGKVVVASIEGSFTVKFFERTSTGVFLIPANEKYQKINVTNDPSFEIWGVVIHTIHSF
jgi:DNA polymerase V